MLETTRTSDTPHDLADAAEAYVARTLHVTIGLRPWPIADQLPPYLSGAYRLMQAELGGVPVLWLLADEPVAPRALQKHIDALGTHWAGTTVAVFRSIPSYVRQRLVQRGIAFVVPGAQLYLPDLGFDFRERTTAPPPEREHLRPSAQLLLLRLLHRTPGGTLTASDVASALGYTLMTMSRAVAELDAAGLIAATKAGRAKTFRLAAGPRETWEAAQSRLRTPVVRRVAVPAVEWGDAPRLRAGLSALAEYSQLAAPVAPARAIGALQAREIEAIRRAVDDRWAIVAREEGEEETEVWSYDPRVLSDGPAVDRLSLFLSLRDDTDERVQAALTEMLRGMSW
ncbi:MAG: hypothetical protein C0418_03955 [Coriobacteriaceae bacterium]|nr:hypothetical protein [Coriobacteriaceae bacterium]